ncbi:hypothetical protein NC653_023259 [Populus alba x Populus x berolinensis]|uniref:Uncharacterized protein n=1 Tax=Populus alba x Populus x berolinensis TaxID=444605 RepID=A0AAD6MGR2_9ROSI|nr:hypothetical protein NC653_023259 [Populus alba x Populus x berolinensis]
MKLPVATFNFLPSIRRATSAPVPVCKPRTAVNFIPYGSSFGHPFSGQIPSITS